MKKAVKKKTNSKLQIKASSIWNFIVLHFFNVFVFFAALIGLFFVANENIGRAVFVGSIVVIWFGLGVFSRDFIKSSLIILLLVLPFNVTYILPETIKIAGHELVLANPYVENIKVNYLIATLSIVDLGLVLLVISAFNELFIKILRRAVNFKSFFSIKNNEFIILFPVFVYFIFHNLLFRDFIVLFYTTRIFLVILASLVGVNWYKTKVCSFKDKELSEKFIKGSLLVIELIILMNVVIQIFIGINQFIKGTSLGLSALGESKLVNGFFGVSFADISGSVYLRAYGTFPHPNILAGFLMICILISIFVFEISNNFKFYLYIFKRKFYLKCLSVFIILISSIFTLFTMSRSVIALIVLVIGLWVFSKLVNFSLKKQNKRNFHLNSFSSFISLIPQRFMSLFNSGDFSSKDRENLIIQAWKIIKENWIFGVGQGRFVKFMGENMPYTKGGFTLAQPVHNVFLLIIAEHGLVAGLLIIGFSIYYSIKKILSSVGFLKLPLILTFVSIIGISLLDHYYVSLPQGNLLLAVVVALVEVFTFIPEYIRKEETK